MKNNKFGWIKIYLIVLVILMTYSCLNSGKETHPSTPKPKQTIGITSLEYEDNPNMLHYVLVFVDGDTLEVIKEKIKEFSQQNFSEKLGMNVVTIVNPSNNDKKRTKTLTVRRFGNFEISKRYITKLRESKILEESMKIVAASQDNYRRLLSKKDIEEYIEFYEAIEIKK